jgi:hypothetical protein
MQGLNEQELHAIVRAYYSLDQNYWRIPDFAPQSSQKTQNYVFRSLCHQRCRPRATAYPNVLLNVMPIHRREKTPLKHLNDPPNARRTTNSLILTVPMQFHLPVHHQRTTTRQTIFSISPSKNSPLLAAVCSVLRL